MCAHRFLKCAGGAIARFHKSVLPGPARRGATCRKAVASPGIGLQVLELGAEEVDDAREVLLQELRHLGGFVVGERAAVGGVADDVAEVALLVGDLSARGRVEDGLGDKLAQEEELTLDLVLVARLGVASQGQRVQPGGRVDVLHALLVVFADVVLGAG